MGKFIQQWIEPNHSEMLFEYSQKTSRLWGTWYRYHQCRSRLLWPNWIYRSNTGEARPHKSQWSAEQTTESWLWLWCWWAIFKRGCAIMLWLTQYWNASVGKTWIEVGFHWGLCQRICSSSQCHFSRRKKRSVPVFSVADIRRSVLGFSSTAGEVTRYLSELYLVHSFMDLRSGWISTEHWLWDLEGIVMLIL